jgi:hypothetical protein
MTGHKDYKLADHYSKLDKEFQKETSLKIMEAVRKAKVGAHEGAENVKVLRFGKR